jgi:hypothetical protein
MTVNRRVGLAAVYLAVLTVAVGVPEVLHLHGGSVTHVGVASQSPTAPASDYDPAARQVLSV